MAWVWSSPLGDPMLVDRVAVDFPRLTIILAHPSWPFEEQAIAVARHKSNVYLELSGWSPKYLSRSLLDAVTGPLVDRTLFGTDFPFIPRQVAEGLGHPGDSRGRHPQDRARQRR